MEKDSSEETHANCRPQSWGAHCTQFTAQGRGALSGIMQRCAVHLANGAQRHNYTQSGQCYCEAIGNYSG